MLEGFWRGLVESWRLLATIFGAFQRIFWHLEKFVKIAKNPGESMFFREFRRFWEDSGAQRIKEKQ